MRRKFSAGTVAIHIGEERETAITKARRMCGSARHIFKREKLYVDFSRKQLRI